MHPLPAFGCKLKKIVFCLIFPQLSCFFFLISGKGVDSHFMCHKALVVLHVKMIWIVTLPVQQEQLIWQPSWAAQPRTLSTGWTLLTQQCMVPDPSSGQKNIFSFFHQKLGSWNVLALATFINSSTFEQVLSPKVVVFRNIWMSAKKTIL